MFYLEIQDGGRRPYLFFNYSQFLSVCRILACNTSNHIYERQRLRLLLRITRKMKIQDGDTYQSLNVTYQSLNVIK